MKKSGICLSCAKSFDYDDTRQHGKFCNNKCQQNYIYLTNTKLRVEAGIVEERQTLKNYLIKERGEKCELCNLQAIWENKPLPLILDHIDGNSDFNHPSNIRLVCPNCNSQLPTTKNRTKKFCKRNIYLREYKNYTNKKLTELTAH